MKNVKTFVEKKFKHRFHETNQYIFTSGGRFEILGNHTDHNHGNCLAATCDLCITAAVSKREDKKIVFYSDGYKKIELSLCNLTHLRGNNPSAELIKGVAAYLSNKKYKIGGFNAFCYSTIYSGAGVSSSAAFELLIAKIFNELYNDNSIPALSMCKAGQYSENNYYEKKSGLLDQIGVGYGNIVSIDFKDIANPVIEQIHFPFKDLHFVTVNTGGSHAKLNKLYSAIPNDMINAAKKLGVNYLRETSLKAVNSSTTLTEIEKNRATHFFNENERVANGILALKNENEEEFLKMINESRLSSANLLKNMMVENNYKKSPLEACDYAMELMENNGACKINGGGFAGSIICLVPTKYLNYFLLKMSRKYGKINVKEIFVRNTGPTKE